MRFIRAASLSLPLVSSVALAAPCGGFTDVDSSNPAHAPFCASVEWMKNRGITLGLTPTLYDPNSAVTRLQMAAFMYRLGFQNAFLQGGNAFAAPAVIGTTDDQPLEVRVNSVRVVRYEPSTVSPNLIGGSPANVVTAGVRGAAILGGGVPTGNTDPDYSDEGPNRVTDHYGVVAGGYANRAGNDGGLTGDAAFATVGGGKGNVASSYFATVGGGQENAANFQHATIAGGERNVSGSWSAVGGGRINNATGSFATIAGGQANTASGLNGSTVGGGLGNNASGSYATIPGGEDNVAQGARTVAVGHDALAIHSSSFVWNGWSSGTAASFRSNAFQIHGENGLSVEYGSRRADGGGNSWVFMGSGIVGQAIATSTGAFLSTGGQWTNNSDRGRKTAEAEIDPLLILDKVGTLRISAWSYVGEDVSVRHIGPMAQDFYRAFGLGAHATAIGTVDADGIALAAIQGLNAKHEAERRTRDAEIAALRAELSEIRSLLQERAIAPRP